jgi:hypothetical protein
MGGDTMIATVDKAARLRLRGLVQQLLSREISPRAYDDSVWGIQTEDPAVQAIRSRLWFAYSDTPGAVFDPERLPRETKEAFQRCITFLASELPYKYTRKKFITPLALLKWIPIVRREIERQDSDGDWSVWPFFSRDDQRLVS